MLMFFLQLVLKQNYARWWNDLTGKQLGSVEFFFSILSFILRRVEGSMIGLRLFSWPIFILDFWSAVSNPSLSSAGYIGLLFHCRYQQLHGWWTCIGAYLINSTFTWSLPGLLLFFIRCTALVTSIALNRDCICRGDMGRYFWPSFTKIFLIIFYQELRFWFSTLQMFYNCEHLS